MTSEQTARLDWALLHRLTPELLREHVTAGGGTVANEWDYRYTPAQGGDGESGVYTITFATADGVEVGQVGFLRSKRADDTISYTAADFNDYRRAPYDNGGYIHDDQAGYETLLSAFLPAGDVSRR